MSVVICPGIHSSQLTDSFIKNIQTDTEQVSNDWLIFPARDYPSYSPIAIYQWLEEHQPSPAQAPSLLFITFSAGVVGGIGAALTWQMRGGKVKAFLALDGWGVPLVANFPLYRLSHDYFTHWSSALLGTGAESFYAEPKVEHLDLWRSPHISLGWWVKRPGLKIYCSAAKLVRVCLKQYGEME
ncbi:hypothetical protein IQ238_25750 [Pleurocapsales cyanobacterium LEGE 06147]|nr:hypothetical protein [Pleurocapsales cyanobacterium LEGE 06147]